MRSRLRSLEERARRIVWHTEPWFNGHISTEMLIERIVEELEALLTEQK